MNKVILFFGTILVGGYFLHSYNDQNESNNPDIYKKSTCNKQEASDYITRLEEFKNGRTIHQIANIQAILEAVKDGHIVDEEQCRKVFKRSSDLIIQEIKIGAK